MSTAVVFSERALAPGGDAIWPAALAHLARRFGSIRELDVAGVPERESAVGALEAWAGDDVSSWRLELGRFYDDHARMHLRRDPGTAALLTSLRANGVRLAAYGQGPREASAVTLAFLGLDRRLDAVVWSRRRRLCGLPGCTGRGRGAPRQLARSSRRYEAPPETSAASTLTHAEPRTGPCLRQ